MSDTSAFELIIEDDEGRRSVVPIRLGDVGIGRLDGNAIRLDERNVSRRHARLVKEHGSVFAEDLASFNGLWVNGDRVQGRRELREGDLIRIGDFQLELRGEGLQRRAEDTTQKTPIAPERETTHSAIRMGDTSPTVPTRLPRELLRQLPASVSDVVAEEATAIIRVGASEPAAPSGQTTAVAGERAKLVCVSTQLAGREIEIAKTEVVIGRTADNDIALDHRSVSRHHAKIVAGDRRHVLHDLKSANGTLVNGEAYAQTELRRGDLVELGHVKLRFVPPGESYTLSADELAALRSPAAPSGDEPAARRVPLAIVLAVVGVLVVGMLIAIAVLVGAGRGATSARSGSELGAASEVGALLGRARLELVQRRWDEALGLASQVLAVDGGNAEARELADKAEAERRAQASYDEATRAVAAADWHAAWMALEQLPESSVYAAQSGALADRVRGALVAELAARGRAALESQQLEAAAAHAREIARIDGSRPELAQLRAEIERRSRRAAGAAAKAPRAEVTAPRRNLPAAGTTPVAPAAPAAVDPSVEYGEAASLLKAGDTSAAIEVLNRCIQADPAYALCYRALGIAHARGGNTARAAKHYRQYLKVAPGAPDAGKVRQLLEQYETAP